MQDQDKVRQLLSIMRLPGEKAPAFLEKAWEFALYAYRDRKHYSRPLIEHAYGTAKIVAQLGLGRHAVAAALLHDVLTETTVTEEEIRTAFDEKMRLRLSALRTLSQAKYRDSAGYAEGMLKFFIAASHDLRVLIVKIAERVALMRDMGQIPVEVRIELAKETMALYVPLAHRLSMRDAAREMEDYSFEILDPKAYRSIKKEIHLREPVAEKELSRFKKKLLKLLGEEEIHVGSADTRLKSVYSIYKKIGSKGSAHSVYDIRAVRVTVENVGECYRVLGLIHKQWTPLPGRIKDYIATPKPNGYQSLHTTVFIGQGITAEVQIRTKEMHEYAKFGVAAHEQYKKSKGSVLSNWLKRLVPQEPKAGGTATEEWVGRVAPWICDLVDAHEYVEHPQRLMEDLASDLLKGRMFIFDPQGSVLDLPVGATVIDFAFSLGKAKGLHLSGATVNGKFVPIETELRDGDIVAIVVKRTAHPTARWLSAVTTTQARKEIGAYLALPQSRQPELWSRVRL